MISTFDLHSWILSMYLKIQQNLKRCVIISAGHLTYQYYNATSVGLTHDFVDVESTSSDSENELKQLEILLEEKKKKDAEAAGV